MGKFAGLIGKGKGMINSAIAEGKPILLATGGVIIGQKFLDFKTLFPNVDPNKWFIKHEGAIKVGGVILTLALWKKCPVWLKYVLWGIGIQGAVKEVRTLTMNDAGKSFFEAIGSGQYSDEINAAANKILDFAANTSQTGVSGNDDMGAGKGSASKVLDVYASTGVSGMGMTNDIDYAA